MGSIFQDGVTPVDAALVDKLVKSDGNAQFQIMGFRIYWATSWTIWDWVGNRDPATIAAISLSWDNPQERLEIDMSGLSAIDSEFGNYYPAVVVSPSYRTGTPPAAANYIPQAVAVTQDLIYVRFFDFAGDHITSINSQMDFNILIFGHYST